MNSKIPGAENSTYSIREAAWILGITESEVCRLIRQGVLLSVRRRSKLVVPAHGLARLFPPPATEGGGADERC